MRKGQEGLSLAGIPGWRPGPRLGCGFGEFGIDQTRGAQPVVLGAAMGTALFFPESMSERGNAFFAGSRNGGGHDIFPVFRNQAFASHAKK